MFTKESLELLRQRIDLAEVLSSYLTLHRAGAAYKALCPFHEEKTASFMMQKGDTHYHCFGCGAHGDAIAFLMTHVKMGFAQAVEHLAERFGVPLEKTAKGTEERGPSKVKLKDALAKASELYHYLLLHSEEGQVALHYLYKRGLDLSFIQTFQIGFAPKEGSVLLSYARERGIETEILEAAGLKSVNRSRDFFSDRITFPIRDALGAVIGFSARKFKEETYGGKYINTPETLLFKKSRVLFGLSDSRARIAKEGKAIVVEGQIDALRLIHAGFNYVVAGQGTAFGQEHVKELLQLGIKTVYLALDGDKAGQEAAVKIGHLFQIKGIEVRVVALPPNTDPDMLLTEQGPAFFSSLLESAPDYLSFVFAHMKGGEKELSAARKNEIVSAIATSIRQAEMPVMVHESLKKLAQIARVPEELLDIRSLSLPHAFVKKSAHLGVHTIDPARILEGDFLRWLLFASGSHPELIQIARKNIALSHLTIPGAAPLYATLLQSTSPPELLSLGASCETLEEQGFLSDIMQRKVNLIKAVEGFQETVRQLLQRYWMQQKEAIRLQLASGELSEEESLEKAKEFDHLNKHPPQVVL